MNGVRNPYFVRYFEQKNLICQGVSIHSHELTGYNLSSIVRVSLAKDKFMDTDDLDQVEKQIHELLLVCVDLRKENEALKKCLHQQTTELDSLTQQREATDEKVSYLLTCLGPSEPQDE